jgi:type II secretory pathway pseudopilin PulG
MNRNKLVQALIGAGLIACIVPSAYAADTSAQRIQLLENQIKVMQQQLEELKTTLVKSQEAAKPAPAAAASTDTKDLAKQVEELRNQVDSQAKETVVAGDIPNSFRIPGSNTSMHLYGIAELNLTHDFSGYNGNIDYASFVPYVPLNGSTEDRKGSTSLHTRTSRFGMEAATPSSFGLVTAKIEGDFNNDQHSNAISTQQATNSYNFRLRQAYVQAGSWLVGQSWTTFIDLDAAPETVDFNGPVGTTSMRQPQIRYTYKTPTAGNYTVALENPDSYILKPDGSDSPYDTATAMSRLPDVVLRWDRASTWGTLSFRGVTQQFLLKNGELGNDSSVSARGWGLAASSSIKMFDNDLLSLNFTGGEGVGRYFNYIEGAGYDATNNKIVMEKVVGTVLGYQHKFNDQYRLDTAFGYQRSLTNDFTDWARATGLAAEGNRYDMNRSVWQLHVGGFWNPTKEIEVGLEAIYGQRKTLANEKGDASRINFLTRYYFN